MPLINIGTSANDGTGTSLRAAAIDILNPTGLRKNNFSATGAPTVGDDSADGYEVGSEWHDTATSRVWKCLSAAEGAAVWERILTDETPEDIGEQSSLADSDRVLGVTDEDVPVSVPATSVIRGDGTILRMVALTQTEYDALDPGPVTGTAYHIIPE